MKPEDIDAIMIHCSATKAGVDIKAADIDKMHRARGFKMIGYHFVIDLDGTVEVGRPLTMNGAHCEKPGFSGKPYNSHSIGICYVGGLDKDGKPADTRTPEQKAALPKLVWRLFDEYEGIKEILGHRDASQDLNGDGEISKYEWCKACPCFDVRAEFPVAMITEKRALHE